METLVNTNNRVWNAEQRRIKWSPRSQLTAGGSNVIRKPFLKLAEKRPFCRWPRSNSDCNARSQVSLLFITLKFIFVFYIMNKLYLYYIYLIVKGWRMSSAHSPTFLSLHLRQNSFSNLSVALPTSQRILQPFRCFTYVTVHSPTLISLLLPHKLFT